MSTNVAFSGSDTPSVRLTKPTDISVVEPVVVTLTIPLDGEPDDAWCALFGEVELEEEPEDLDLRALAPRRTHLRDVVRDRWADANGLIHLELVPDVSELALGRVTKWVNEAVRLTNAQRQRLTQDAERIGEQVRRWWDAQTRGQP